MRLMLETRMTDRAHRFAPAIVAVALLAGCASGGADLSPSASEPAKKPFQPPSFEAKVYQNAELGFSVHYPADFLEQASPPEFELLLPEAEVLLLATSPQQVPGVSILLHPTLEGLSLEEYGERVLSVFAQLGGGEAKLESAKETTLKDGVTEAMEFLVVFPAQEFPLKSLNLFVPRGPQTVQVGVNWLHAMGDRESQKVDEIAYSLYFE